MNWLRSQISRSPGRARVLGKIVFLVGAILILGAVFARAGLMNANADRSQARLPAVHTLAEVYPQYATQLVPEGPVGFTFSALLVLAGMALIVLAEGDAKRERAQSGRVAGPRT
jgi:Na+/proline symporter